MELTLQEKRKLIKFFDSLLDKEVSKPLGQMNSEAVDNYVEVLLDLQDKHIELSPEYIDEQVRKIFHPEDDAVVPGTVKTNKKYFNKKKVWLIAACVAILVTLFSIVSFSSERSVKDILEDYLGTFEFIPFGDKVDVGNESYEKGSDTTIYKSLEDLAEKEKINLLYPETLKASVQRIPVDNTENNQTIDILHENSDVSVGIFLNSDIPQDTLDFCNDKITLNGIDYYLCIMEDVNQAQAYYVYDNNMYRIIHTNKTGLMEILDSMDSMEIIKYEN